MYRVYTYVYLVGAYSKVMTCMSIMYGVQQKEANPA